MKLFPYQEAGRDWLASRKLALLADEMGLGKTVQAITAADEIFAERILVVCPAVARFNWEREFRNFSRYHRPFQVLLSGNDQPRRGTSVVTSYEIATRRTDLGKFDLGVIDEGHFLKNPEAKRTKAIFGDNGLSRSVRHLWCLTGTPMPNHPGELWVYLKTFGQTKLSYESFCRKFCKWVPGYKNHLQIKGRKPERDEELKKLLHPIMLRRTVKGVGMELPDLFYGDVVVEAGPVTLTPEQIERATKEEGMLKALVDFSKPITPDKMKVLETVAKSISTLRLYNGLQKVESVAELVADELDAGQYQKILIFAIHTQVIAGLAQKLNAHGVGIINGSTSAQRRQEYVDAFQTGPMRVLICNIKAAGTALTLTAADQVLFVEAEWSPGDNRQAAKRAHRIGQTRPVFARFVGIANSIDEKIQSTLRRKTADIDAIFDT